MRLDIQTLCLQNQSPAGKEKNDLESEATILIRFLDLGKTVKGGADKIAFFSSPNLSGHTVADFAAAHHQHTAPAQLLAGDVVEIPLFVGVVRLEVLRFTQLWADGDVSELINLAAVAFLIGGARHRKPRKCRRMLFP